MLVSKNDIDRPALRALVEAFYLDAREDPLLGPVFERYVANWDEHLARMTDFWASMTLRDGGYSGHPLEMHRAIPELTPEMFIRWVNLFSSAAHRQFGDTPATRLLSDHARRMGAQMSRVLL